MKLFTILSSYITMFVLLIILAIGAAYGTFIENDFGNAYAKTHIYTSWWYQTLLFLAAFNLIFVFLKYKVKLWRPGPLFHFSFIVILLGAFITHHFGVDGTMKIREGEKSNKVSLGHTQIETPFYIQLNDFDLKRYPGSRAPSAFQSFVTVQDLKGNKVVETSIYMNHTLTYKGYKFFQSSYDEDEKGTVLSVNKDPGMLITYIGYAVLFLTLILTLFDKKSRFRYLIREISRANLVLLLGLFFGLCTTSNLFAQEKEYSTYVNEYLNDHRVNSLKVSEQLGKLIVQGPTGRMKPLNTQNIEILNKLTGKNTWKGMTADQVILGIVSRPDIWRKVNIIRVKTPKLKRLIGVNPNQKLVSFIDFFNEKEQFLLSKPIEEANKIPPFERGTFERDLIQVNELIEIYFMMQRGMLLKLFPKPNDVKQTWVDLPTSFLALKNDTLSLSLTKMLDAIYSRDYKKASTFIPNIETYQSQYGSTVIPSKTKVSAELWYNKLNVFIKLSISYLLLGLTLLIYSLVMVIKHKEIKKSIRKTMYGFTAILFVIHTIAIGVRWYISGYMPISNTYETMVFIAYSSIFGVLVFFRKSILALGAGLMMAGIFLFTAYLGEINPQITSLVPVLKSYWLSIHVSVITASYGFFGMSAILGIVTLILYVFKNYSKHLDKQIKQLTFVNEAIVILAIVLLTIGNFLGGIWANESWGRYWGWDPKETWTYVSILIYTMLLHLRFIKKIYSPFLFNVLAIFSFYSILMTYYGVNYYLTGMHSYATGEPVPIPNWVYITLIMVLVLIVLSYKNRKLNIK